MECCSFPSCNGTNHSIVCDLRVLPTGLRSQPIALMVSAVRNPPLGPSITNAFEDLATHIWASRFSDRDPRSIFWIEHYPFSLLGGPPWTLKMVSLTWVTSRHRGSFYSSPFWMPFDTVRHSRPYLEALLQKAGSRPFGACKTKIKYVLRRDAGTNGLYNQRHNKFGLIVQPQSPQRRRRTPAPRRGP